MEPRNDGRDKLLSLNEKFSSVIDQFAEWGQVLLNGDEHSVQKAMDSIMKHDELRRFLYDPHFKTEFRELFSLLLKIPRNTAGELPFSRYEFHNEEFIRNNRVTDRG